MDPRGRASRPLSPVECDVLRWVTEDGATAAVHGYDHRTRYSSPRRWSELSGRSPVDLAELLDRSFSELTTVGLEPSVFVPPFNRFDPEQLAVLAERFEVVCGGPETVVHVGFQRTPAWLSGTVYLPSYPPLYGTAREVLRGLPRILMEGAGLWLPIVLHWSWETDSGLGDLEGLLEMVGPLIRDWREFLEEVRASR
jgi:hypothetical protein